MSAVLVAAMIMPGMCAKMFVLTPATGSVSPLQTARGLADCVGVDMSEDTHASKPGRVPVTCPCGTVFEASASRIASGRGKYCSQACKYKYRKRPSGLVYNVVKENPTSFKSGHVPWHKGRRVHLSPATEFKPGEHRSPGTEFKPGQATGEANARWAGDDVGYCGLHSRVYKEWGPAADYMCVRADKTCKGPMNWANLSGEYLGVEDFAPMCQSHHFRHDGVGKRK